MKKLLFATLLSAAFAANSAEVGLTAGKVKAHDQNVYSLSLGTSLLGLKVSSEVKLAKDVYTSVGADVGKEFKVWKVGVTPHIGGAYVQSDLRGKESGSVISTGVEFSYNLTKGIALVGDYSYTWDLQSKTDFQGGQFMAGIRVNF
jgi:hypothetical protein